jgi:hypothetical protein
MRFVRIDSASRSAYSSHVTLIVGYPILYSIISLPLVYYLL